MTYERFDSAFLPVLRGSGDAITASQLAARCSDPWAPPNVEDWLREAFDRGLVNVRRQGDFPAEWKLTRKGRRSDGRRGP